MDLLGDVETERLRGRRPTLADLDDYLRIWTDLRIPEDVWLAERRSEDDVERVLRATIAHWERWGFGAWTAVERATGDVVGRVGLAHRRLEGGPEVELAWFLDVDVWGRGYATELGREAVRVAFDELELDDVVALAEPADEACRAVMVKVGLRYERALEVDGLEHVLFRLLRADRPPR